MYYLLDLSDLHRKENSEIHVYIVHILKSAFVGQFKLTFLYRWFKFVRKNVQAVFQEEIIANSENTLPTSPEPRDHFQQDLAHGILR